VTQHVVALLGISGVGKSTLLRELSNHVAFQHLQASSLIRDGRRAAAEARELSLDALRHANINENQQFLIAGYARSVDPRAGLVILDGHSVIDTPSGLVSIDPPVFAALGITWIIFLADTPSAIMRRRQGDVSRNRPARSSDDLDAHQDMALLNALKICLDLRVPLNVMTPAQSGYLRRLLLEIGTGAQP
jgi:adenylate kinase